MKGIILAGGSGMRLHAIKSVISAITQAFIEFENGGGLGHGGQKLTLNSVIQRDPNVISAAAGEDVVMANINRGEYYGVMKVAREILAAIEDPKKISDLIEALATDHKSKGHFAKRRRCYSSRNYWRNVSCG
jgi:hypothetical protein